MLHIGSCIRSQEEQEDYASTALSMENEVPCSVSLLRLLYRLWNLMGGHGDEYYHPDGICEPMNKERIQLDLG